MKFLIYEGVMSANGFNSDSFSLSKLIIFLFSISKFMLIASMNKHNNLIFATLHCYSSIINNAV